MAISVLVDRIARFSGIKHFKRAYRLPELGLGDHDHRHGPMVINSLPTVGVMRAISAFKRKSVPLSPQLSPSDTLCEAQSPKSKYVSVQTREIPSESPVRRSSSSDGFLGRVSDERNNRGSIELTDISYESIRPSTARYYDPVHHSSR